jgi:integrase
MRMYAVKAGHLARCLGHLDVDVLHLDHVQEYIRQRLAEGASRSTVRKELVTLRQTLRMAHDRGVMAREPSACLPRFKARYVPRDRWLTPQEAARLVAMFLEPRRRWLLVALYTGARRSELEALTWEDHVNMAEGWILLPGTKTARARRKQPLSQPLRKLLEAVPAKRGAVVQPWPNAVRDLAAACHRAGMARAGPNDLRRTFASWLKQAGVDTLAVTQLMGHTSGRMVELVYGHLNMDTFRAAVEHLPALQGDGQE